MRNVFQTYFDDEWKQLRKSSDHYYLRYYLVWKPGAPCSKDVAKHTIYGEHFVIICALENVGLRTPLSRENMKIQNIINLYAYRSRMCSLEKFRGDVNSRDLLHNLNIPSYTLLLRMSDNLGTTFLVMGISVKLLINFQFSTSATSTVIGSNSKIHPKSWKKQNLVQMQKKPSPRARNP